MGSNEATTAAPGADNPQERRTCTKCNAERVVSPETWPYRKGRTGHYQAHGGRCMECEKKRKSEYEERRDKIALAIKAPEPTAKDKGDGKRKEKLDVTAALKAGGHALNTYAPSVLARLIEYMEDPESPHHQWALELFAQRILPRKLFEELGGQAAGVGALGDKRPSFTINILPAQPGDPVGQVYEHEPLSLPAPADSE